MNNSTKSDAAAPSSRQEREDSEQPGFLSRLKSVFGTAPAEAEKAEPAVGTIQPVSFGDSAYLTRNIQKLHEIRLSDISIPQADIVAVDLNASFDELMSKLREHGYSRMPVYEDNLDNPVGLIHIKDVFIQNGFEKTGKPFSIKPFVRPLLYVPPSMRLAVLLQRMQTDHIHMALIIDEYGGVDGLITIEDVLEQIVGDITDEHDEAEEKLWTSESDGIFVAQARAPLQDFISETGLDLQLPEADEEIDTLGGLVFYLTARVPAKGEVIRTGDGHELEIIEADPRRIKRIRVRNPEAASKATPAAAVKATRN